MVTKWRHNALAHDLAVVKANGNRVVFEDIPMGRAGSERPDVYCISKSFTKPQPTTYEIKVNRSDFLTDVRKSKWESYRPYSEYIFFACPDGLLTPAEIPDGCGLIVRKAKVWRVLKQATSKPVDVFDESVVVKLLIASHSGDRCTDGGYRKHLENRFKAVAYIGEKMGGDIAAYCSKNFSDREKMLRKTYEATEIIKAVRGITGTPSWQGMHTVIEDLKRMLKNDKP